MNFLRGSKKRRMKSELPNIRTETSGNKTTTRNNAANFQTTPTIPHSEYFANSGWMVDQTKHLNAYINELVKENERLQNIVDDSKTTNQLTKQMLNNYVNQINEQTEDIKSLKSDNLKLQEEINELQKKKRRRNDVLIGGSGPFNNMNTDEEPKSSNIGRVSRLLGSKVANYDFQNKHEDLLLELNKIKAEMQGIASTSDDEEPEITHNQVQKLSKRDVLSSLVEDNSDEDGWDDKLQSLLDNSIMMNQRILFADKNNQIWEIIKQNDLNVEDELPMLEGVA